MRETKLGLQAAEEPERSTPGLAKGGVGAGKLTRPGGAIESHVER